MKKALLASTALVGAALLSAPATAGSVGTGDNMSVTLSGFMWFQVSWLDEDLQAGYGRGLAMQIPETEITVHAENTADNGIKYGFEIELETNTDISNNADEVWAFLDGDFGHVRLGDNDGAANTMLVGAYQTYKGISGPLGCLGGLCPVFHSQHLAPARRQVLTRTDFDNTTTSDATKIIYFSPRFSGFQVGASYTPDSGSNGASFTERDDDGDYENVFDVGVNFTNKFDDVGVSISALYEWGDGEVDTSSSGNSTGGTTKEDLSIWYIGAKVDFAGFAVGANYADFGDSHLTSANTANGDDAGHLWQVGVGYGQGPWGISAFYGYGESTFGNGSSPDVDEKITRIGVGGSYAVAPGWQVRADYNYVEHENRGGVAASSSNPDNESQAFILTNLFSF